MKKTTRVIAVVLASAWAVGCAAPEPRKTETTPPVPVAKVTSSQTTSRLTRATKWRVYTGKTQLVVMGFGDDKKPIDGIRFHLNPTGGKKAWWLGAETLSQRGGYMLMGTGNRIVKDTMSAADKKIFHGAVRAALAFAKHKRPNKSLKDLKFFESGVCGIEDVAAMAASCFGSRPACSTEKGATNAAGCGTEKELAQCIELSQSAQTCAADVSDEAKEEVLRNPRKGSKNFLKKLKAKKKKKSGSTTKKKKKKTGGSTKKTGGSTKKTGGSTADKELDQLNDMDEDMDQDMDEDMDQDMDEDMDEDMDQDMDEDMDQDMDEDMDGPEDDGLDDPDADPGEDDLENDGGDDFADFDGGEGVDDEGSDYDSEGDDYSDDVDSSGDYDGDYSDYGDEGGGGGDEGGGDSDYASFRPKLASFAPRASSSTQNASYQPKIHPQTVTGKTARTLRSNASCGSAAVLECGAGNASSFCVCVK